MRRSAKATVAGLASSGLFLLGCSVGADLVSYEDLPAEEQRYTLEVTVDEVTTVWEYSSAMVTEADAPELQPCVNAGLGDGSQGECRPEPLIFLKYDLALAMDETVPAGQPHEITVTGYYQQRLSEPPEVTDLQVEASFDGGGAWQEVAVEAAGENTFTATIPAGGDTGGTVALRVSGTDSDGNTVVQTMPEAYGLS